MVEVAIAIGSVPPNWFDDDRMLLTMIDVMRIQAEKSKRRK